MPLIDKDQKVALPHASSCTLFGKNWQNYKRRTLSELVPLHQQRPMSLILSDLTRVEARVTIIILAGEGVILIRELAGAEGRAVTKPWQARDSQTTMTVPTDSNKCKVESRGAKHPFRGKGRENKKISLNECVLPPNQCQLEGD